MHARPNIPLHVHKSDLTVMGKTSNEKCFVHTQHRVATVKIHDEDAEIYFKNPTYEGSSGQNGVPVGMYDVIRTPYQRVEGNGHTYETLDNQQAQRKYIQYSPCSSIDL